MINGCKAQRKKWVDKHLPNDDRSILLLTFFTHEYHLEYSNRYFPESRFILNTLERVVSPDHHYQIYNLRNQCINDLYNWLVKESALWVFDEEPSEEALLSFLDDFNNKKDEVESGLKSVMSSFDKFMATEQAENVVRIGNKNLKL